MDYLPTYLPVRGSGDVTAGGIVDGGAEGDLLILEGCKNPTAGTVAITDTGSGSTLNISRNLTLRRKSTLTLIWNGARWIELNHNDNYP